MSKTENDESKEKNSERISHLNEIFEDLVSDASELVKDLNWGVKTYLFYGLIMILFGIQSMVYNIDSFQEQHYKGKSLIVYGHTPVKEPRKINNTINIDTGAVFGGALTAFCYPEQKIVSVPSSLPYVPEKFRSFDD